MMRVKHSQAMKRNSSQVRPRKRAHIGSRPLRGSTSSVSHPPQRADDWSPWSKTACYGEASSGIFSARTSRPSFLLAR